MGMTRAYSLLEIKSFDDDARTFEGIATTPSTDRMDDIVEPMGAVFKLPLPMMWQHGLHSMKDPVGAITGAKPGKDGIAVKGYFAKLSEPPSLKEDLDRAWALVKSKLVRGLSIGFNPLESEPIKGSFGERYTKWEWLELSPVAIPANQDASIISIKALDQAQQRAGGGEFLSPGEARALISINGATRVVRLDESLPPPGVSGSHSKPAKSGPFSVPKGNIMGTKTIAEQLSEFGLKRTAAMERMDAIMAAAGEEGRSLNTTEAEEYDGLEADVKSIDSHLVRLKAHQTNMVDKAVKVTADAGTSESKSVEIRGGGQSGVISVRRNLEKGIPFVRYALAMVAAKGNTMLAAKMAERWKDSPEVANCLNFAVEHGSNALVEKAAVAAGTALDATWAGPLVQYQDMAGEFIELLRPLTILGKLNLRRVPFNIRIPRQTAGVTGAFVGEGAPKPVNAMAFDTITMQWFKAAVIVVLTDELVKFSNPAAETLAREDMLAGVAQYLDKRFIDPTYAGVANVSPASITNGITARQSTGVTIAAITADVKALITGFVTNNLSLSSGAWIMSPKSALGLAMIRNTNDEFAFPGVSISGGTFFGLPVITSGNVALSGSPTDSFVVLLDQQEILLADDGQISIDMSQEASLQMNDAPSAGAQSLVSLWQNNMIGLRAEVWKNWRRRRDSAVAVLDSVNW